MSKIFFDKSKAIHRLEEGGLPRSQAEAVTETIHEALEASVATTTDLALTEQRLKSEIAAVRSDFRLAISEAKSDLQTKMIDLHKEISNSSRWVIGTVVVVAVAGGLFQYLLK